MILDTQVVLWADTGGSSELLEHFKLNETLKFLCHFARRVVINTACRLRLVEGPSLVGRPKENSQPEASPEEQVANDVHAVHG